MSYSAGLTHVRVDQPQPLHYTARIRLPEQHLHDEMTVIWHYRTR
jgi:hypothetical protein